MPRKPRLLALALGFGLLPAVYAPAQAQTYNTGTDYSANPAPVPIAGYVLVVTIPANAGRASVEVQNQSAAQIQVVRDDGTGANQSSVLLASGGAVGAQGGSWSSTTFRGRVRVYAPTSTAQVAAYQE